VSHDPMAAEYADRVLALRDGRLSDHGAERGVLAEAAAAGGG
jgi:ABC-type hemin transport system ATPase subunit